MHISTRKGSAHTRRPFIFVVCPFAAVRALRPVRALRGLEQIRGGQKPGTPVNG